MNDVLMQAIGHASELEEMRIHEIRKFMGENVNETIEVPVNLLYVIMQYLDATRCYLDKGEVPYPATQWSASALSHLLHKMYLPEYRDRIGGSQYELFDMLHKVNTQFERDIDIDSINEWVINGDIKND